MRLNRKFTFIILFTIVQSCILTIFSIVNLKRIQAIKDYQNMEAKSEAQLTSIIDYLEKMDYWDFDIENAYSAFDGKKSELSKTFSYLTENPVTSQFSEAFDANLKQVKLTWQLIEEGLAPIDEILKNMQSYKLNSSLLKNIQNFGIRESAKLYTEGNTMSDLLSMTEEAHQQLRKIRLLYVSLMSLNEKSSVMINEAIQSVEKRFIFITILFALVTTIIIAFLILIVTTSISKRIIKIRNMTTTLADKDFNVKIEPEGSDEMWYLMTNINNMVSQINSFFMLVKTTAKKALDAEASINESAGSTAEATKLIDTNIDEINKKFQEVVTVITSAIGVIAEMNLHVETLVKNNSVQTASIENSNAAVKEVVKTLNHINSMAEERVRSAEEMHSYVADGDEKISATNDILNKIAQQLDEVYEVVTIINNVAEQTNLLSMNAAIESAHAGEAGKGFGVVAEEIRSLAEETSENADKISKVINAIVEAVESANDSSKSAFTAFEKVSSHTDEIITSLQEITDGIGKIDNQMQEIKQRSDESSSAANDMNRYCGELADKQKHVSVQVDKMNDVVFTALKSLHQIKGETADIVNKMNSVSSASDQSYKNLTELETVLEDFKTAEVEEKIEENITEEKSETIKKDVEDEIEVVEELEDVEDM